MASQPNLSIAEWMPPVRCAATRTRAVYRSATIVGRHDAGLCWVQNLSDGGAMVETGIHAAVGEAVRLELADGIAIDGSIVWRAADRAGIAFSPPIDSLGLLRQLADDRSNGRWRPARLPLNKLVEVASELGPSILRLQDISQSGLQLRHIGNLSAGMPITVHLSPGLVVKGVVRWKRDSVVGVELEEMIPVCALMSRAAFESDL